MHLGFGDGSRVGALVHTVLYLIGVPIFLNNHDIHLNEGNQTSLETYSASSENSNLPDHCYESLGCFTIRYPERKGYNMTPNLLEEVSPTICLYTKVHVLACQVVENEAITSEALAVANGRIFWIAHGYIENGQRPWIKDLVNALLDYDSFANVFVVDWSEASKPPYNQAVENVEMIAALCAHLMVMLQETYGLKVNETHFIGHSLGAQLGGYLGSWLQQERGLQLGRISGLDPAQLYFQGMPIDARLDPSDSLFVDVTHTDAKPFLYGGEEVSFTTPNMRPISGLGTEEPCGHADFYPNSGKDQPGCKDGVYQAILQEEGSVINGTLPNFIFLLLDGCDHIRSHEYFTESVTSVCPFMAFSCESWEDFASSTCTNLSSRNRMGFHATKPTLSGNVTTSEANNSSVIYYSQTGPRAPFCREHFRIVIQLAEESKYRSTSELHLVLENSSGESTVLNLGNIDFTGKDLVRKYTVSGVYVGFPKTVILRPSSSNPLRWLMTRITPPIDPDVVVDSITLRHLESMESEVTFCPDSKNFLSTTEQNPSIIFTSDNC
ncbi:Pancreatic triacylglycerol lipase [Orchesella cincta]|uniref:Pancreatic triacylglycerol lipase n=1 Tax=Orchesella cincta TaxID=48709 RepID=A0A1D2N9F4_ORCCI|nr:Pancreatic triacylglycerol lipase [Orchesella cincta]